MEADKGGDFDVPTHDQQDTTASRTGEEGMEQGDATTASKAVQDMVNEALETKLQGFQTQMQQMLSLIQGAAGLPSVEPQPPAASSVKTEPTSVSPQDRPSEGENQVPQGSDGAVKEVEAATETVKEVRETAAQRRKRFREEAKQRYQEEVAKMEQEQKEFRQFLETIAPLLNLPLPGEEAAKETEDTVGETKTGDAVADDATSSKEEMTSADDAAPGGDTAPGDDTILKGDTILGDDTAPKHDIVPEDDTATGDEAAPEDGTALKEDTTPGDDTAPKDDVVPTDETLPEDTTKKPPVLRFPADDIVKECWEKVEGKSLTNTFFDVREKICYQWPPEDKETFGRVPAVNSEVLVHLNDLNRDLHRKSFAGLPMDQSRFNKEIKLMESMFRYQQRIHSYASYLLQALGQHVNGESSLDEETLSGLLGYLGKSLSDACDTSVQGCIAATRVRRRIYVDSMGIDHPGNAQYSVLNKPLSKDLFPPDLKETYANCHIVLSTSASRKRGPPRQREDLPEEEENAAKKAKKRKRSKKTSVPGAQESESLESAPPKQNGSLQRQGGPQRGRPQQGRRDQQAVPQGRGKHPQGPRMSPLSKTSRHEDQAFRRSPGGSFRGSQHDSQRQMGGAMRSTGMGMSRTARRRRRGKGNERSSSPRRYGGSSTYTPGRNEYVGSAVPTMGPSSYGYGQNSISYRYDDSPVSSFDRFSPSDYGSSSYQDFSRPSDYASIPKYSGSSYQDFSRPLDY